MLTNHKGCVLYQFSFSNYNWLFVPSLVISAKSEHWSKILTLRQWTISTQLLKDDPRAIYTHCYGHALNLACQDTVRSVKVVKDALDTSKRNAAFKEIKDAIAPAEPGFRTLCPTRWTVKADSLRSVIANYSVLQTSLDIFTDMAARDMEMSARVNGIASQLKKFDFLFGVFLGEKVLKLADNLSCTLQRKELSAAEGNSAALLTCDTLSTLRTTSEFEQFWHSVINKAAEVVAL